MSKPENSTEISSGELPFVLGTAGHIDHGKTTLIKAMTGYDCDRLKEEKKRGITIELGFAPLVLPGGEIVSVVDVPGHERFIRQMVAGAAGIQGVLLNIAADEGVMPQTREHLDILGLLGISRGIIALTKKDLVDDEMLELALDDVRSAVKGTLLEGAPVVPVSAHNGEGLEELQEEIASMVRKLPLRSPQGVFFYPIDRVFPKQGFGTIVTGTAWSGEIALGQEVQAMPKGQYLRVRGIQVHNRDVPKAWAGQRIAINLSGAKDDRLERGEVLVSPETLVPSSCANVMLRILPSQENNLAHWQRVHVHMGTTEVLGRVALFEKKEVSPGDLIPCQIVLETPQPMLRGQRFILRSYSPMKTIAGGEVVMPYGEKARGKTQRQKYCDTTKKLYSSLYDWKAYFLTLLDQRGCIQEKEVLRILQAGKGEFAGFLGNLAQKKTAHVFGDSNPLIVSKAYMEETAPIVSAEILSRFSKNAQLRGLPLEKILGSYFDVKDMRLLRLIGERLFEKNEEIYIQEDLLRHRAFSQDLENLYKEKMPLLEDLCRCKAMEFPLVEDVQQELELSPNALKNFLEEAKSLKIVALIGNNMVLHKILEDQILGVLEDFPQEITLQTVRDALGSSRKYVLPLLEYFDSKGYTRRVGDKRILRKGVKKSV